MSDFDAAKANRGPLPSPLDELEATVAKMRALGVTEWNGIKLGPVAPAPHKEQTPEEFIARAKREEERRRDVMFAASGTRPFLKAVKP